MSNAFLILTLTIASLGFIVWLFFIYIFTLTCTIPDHVRRKFTLCLSDIAATNIGRF